ncbi:MAG TPA: tetraacyldisaccharide 4'-kinase [Woeseiaceae bacterium]|nr:tetraacyldisaccharide 4'-kinase [Woeseiaceae bacterium]
MSGFINRVWYGDSPWYRVLLPLSWLFARLASLRRRLYRSGVLRSFDVGKPVIVIGNIASGGTGKTPVTMWLASFLKHRGFRPGIVSRGYGGSVGRFPLQVSDDSAAGVVGDEPLLMARRVICPVVVHPDRVAAASMLIEMGCDVVVADDGLQHYRLRRQFEIAVVDGARGIGNGRLFPAGPLREPVSRLESVDLVMVQGADVDLAPILPRGVPVSTFELAVVAVHNLRGKRTVAIEEFRGKTVHGVAAIGNPQRFFRMLESYGMTVLPHGFPDHALLDDEDLDFGDGLDVLMTEKDAVKIGRVVPPHWWYIAVDLKLAHASGPHWLDELESALKKIEGEQKA